MIISTKYLSEQDGIELAKKHFNYNESDLVDLMGRFRSGRWKGKIKGKIDITLDFVYIRDSFGSKTHKKIKNEEWL